jgi:hypothetical protein
MQTIDPVPIANPAIPAREVRRESENEVRAHGARAEIHQLMGELHDLVARSESSGRAAVDEALPAVAKLQVVTANVDACNPTRHPRVAAELVALADRRIRTMKDAFERGLGYTSDNTMRRLLEQGQRPLR